MSIFRKGDYVKEISKQEICWFASRQTKYQWMSYQQKDPFDIWLHQPNRRASRSWLKGFVSITSGILLMCYSFSGVWANPGEDLPPSDVLIPVDEALQQKDNTQTDQPPLEVPNQLAPETETKQKQQSTKDPTADGLKTQKPTQVSPEPQGKASDKSVDQQHKTKPSADQNSTTKSDQQPATTKQSPSTTSQTQSDPNQTMATENGGKLPATATPLMDLLLRGFSLVLMGIGIHQLKRRGWE